VRIAAHRSISQPSTAPLEKDSTPAGASFFEVLAGAVGQPAQSSAKAGITAPRFALPANPDAEAASEQTQPRIASSSKDSVNVPNEIPQAALKSADQKPASGKTPVAPAQSHSNLNASGRDVKPRTLSIDPSASTTPPVVPFPTQLVATPVASIASPQLPVPAETNSDAQSQKSTTGPVEKSVKSVDIPAVTGAGRTQFVSVPVAPSPAPEMPASAEVKSGTQSLSSTDRAVQAFTQSNDKPAAAGAATQSGSQDKSEAPVQKTIAQSAQSPEVDAGKSAPASKVPQPANSAAFSIAPAVLPVAVSPDIVALPNMTFAPSFEDLSLPLSKNAQNNKTTDGSLAKISDAAPTADVKKTNQSQAGASSAGSSPNNVPASGQPATRPQADASQTAPATPKLVDAGSAQIQAIVTQGPIHEAAPSHSHSEMPAVASAANHQPMQADAAESATPSGINTANLIQKMSESEMRVGMHSAEFGDISIRTSVSQQQMTAQISVDHGDLGKAISAHIPAMEAKLGGELGLRALVEVNPGGMQFSGERGYSSQREQKALTPAVQTEGIATSTEVDHAGVRLVTAVDQYRLDIRA
jgi:hypothetical protein